MPNEQRSSHMVRRHASAATCDYGILASIVEFAPFLDALENAGFGEGITLHGLIPNQHRIFTGTADRVRVQSVFRMLDGACK